jgi:hypothetical protein
MRKKTIRHHAPAVPPRSTPTCKPCAPKLGHKPSKRTVSKNVSQRQNHRVAGRSRPDGGGSRRSGCEPAGANQRPPLREPGQALPRWHSQALPRVPARTPASRQLVSQRRLRARDIHPLELDIVLLAILRAAGDLISRPNVQRDIDSPAWSSLQPILGHYRNQILVDEATDFSPIQLACMAALAHPAAALVLCLRRLQPAPDHLGCALR